MFLTFFVSIVDNAHKFKTLQNDRSAHEYVPDSWHSKIWRKFGDLHHLRSVGELFKDPEA